MAHWLRIVLRYDMMYYKYKAKTLANSQWPIHSENNEMTAVTKPQSQDAHELKVHTAGEGDSQVSSKCPQPSPDNRDTLLEVHDTLFLSMVGFYHTIY